MSAASSSTHRSTASFANMNDANFSTGFRFNRRVCNEVNRFAVAALAILVSVAIAVFAIGCASRVRPIQNAVPIRCCSSGVCEAQGHHRLGVPKVFSVGDVQPTYPNDKGGK